MQKLCILDPYTSMFFSFSFFGGVGGGGCLGVAFIWFSTELKKLELRHCCVRKTLFVKTRY